MGSMGQVVPLIGVGLALVVGASSGSVPPGRAAVRPASRRSSPRRRAVRADRARPLPTPDILLTGSTRETRAVEARAAAFVRAVRRRNGPRAVQFLSRETRPPVRAAVERQEWPWRTAPQDLALLFSRPALRLRTIGITRTHARVRIGSQHRSRRSLEAVGFYDLGMVREGARWQVTLPRPSRRPE